MLYAKLETGDTLYVFLHAEQVYRNFRLFDSNLGYYNHEIEESTISDIYYFIEINDKNENIVIDCAEVVDSHNLPKWIDKIIKYCSTHNKRFVFCRMSERLYADSNIHSYIHTYNLSEHHNEDQTYNVYPVGCTKQGITDIELFSLFQKELVKKIESNYIIVREGEKSYSHSSNVQLPRYINIKAFIEQKEISFIGLYLLCKMAFGNNLIGYDKRPLLFFSSMAGSYLASVFSKLACIDMVFLNHLGPKKKLYRERHKEQLLADRDYLIISDVVCLGAEIERAKTLIEHAGGKLKGILSVVLVEVVSERPQTESDIEKVALLTLTKEYNPINYQIKTDFQ